MRLVKSIIPVLYILAGSVLPASGQDTLKLSRDECEALFLKENLLLIAEKLDISKADAAVQQARLWPNPHFTLDQVNFWATDAQTGGQETVPPLFGNFGRNQQFGAEIEQLILTAGKRSKLVALEHVNVEKAQGYFEELLRSLKTEFRKNLTGLQYLQLSEGVYLNQLNSVNQLIRAYQRQVEEGHIPRGEFVRLKALELEIFRNLNELRQEKNEIQKNLKLWMGLSPYAYLSLPEDSFTRKREAISKLVIREIAEEARQNRPDLNLAIKEENYALRQVDYEKAKRIPDVTLKAMYDRNGNTMLNFWGFGASIDLPLFDRNQGNIRQAELSVRQARTLLEYQNGKVENEVILAYHNLVNSIQMMTKIEDGYETLLDGLLEAYTRNFSNRNISMLEFLDFMDTYLENKKIILDAQKSVNDRIEELNYAVGRDLL